MKHWHNRLVQRWGDQLSWLGPAGGTSSSKRGRSREFPKGTARLQFSYSLKSSASSQMWGSPLTFNLLRLLTETGLSLEIWLSLWFLCKHAKKSWFGWFCFSSCYSSKRYFGNGTATYMQHNVKWHLHQPAKWFPYSLPTSLERQ